MGLRLVKKYLKQLLKNDVYYINILYQQKKGNKYQFSLNLFSYIPVYIIIRNSAIRVKELFFNRKERKGKKLKMSLSPLRLGFLYP